MYLYCNGTIVQKRFHCGFHYDGSIVFECTLVLPLCGDKRDFYKEIWK